MSFRSTDSYHFAELYREISDLKKAATKHEAEKKEQADVVQQDKLIVTSACLRACVSSLQSIPQTSITNRPPRLLVSYRLFTEGRSNRLPEVFARPGLDGKRVPGDLEIHQNGLRYQSPLKGEAKIGEHAFGRRDLSHTFSSILANTCCYLRNTDLLFNNMQHLFFQPCDKELIVLIHIHLKSPIMIGKKKAKVCD